MPRIIQQILAIFGKIIFGKIKSMHKIEDKECSGE